MNHTAFQKVEALFHAALEHEPPERNVFLDRIAREHSPEVLAMVQRLLSQDESATRWTDLGVTDGTPLPPPEQEPAGMLLGRFRLDRRLGYGGHGEVYLAEQVEPVRRTVALKMVRAGADSEAAVARFRAEQQALALMSHPNIAAVYEAGLADRGRMYFAMAYVEGEPIDAFCDDKTMTVRERLALFLRVCGAVQHAHLKGLIHRDLKPSNILVTKRDGRPEPVLIDFGIAVATAAGDMQSVDDDATQPRVALGTPAFMSPEQAGPPPRDLDTRSDVYALGVLLCELITGRTPLDLLTTADASLAEIRRCIVEEPAPAPVAILAADDTRVADAAAKRRCTPTQLRRLVRGDLDAIVRRATARDRVDRYQSIEAFAADVENVLRDRPIAVGSVSPFARAARFARRHRATATVAGLVLGTLLVGVIGTSVGMVRADRAARESDAVSSFLQDVLTSSTALEKGATVKFIDVLGDGAAMADDRLADYPRRAGEVHAVLGETYYNLNVYRDAERELERAIELLGPTAGPDDPTRLGAMNTLAALRMILLRLDEAEALVDEVAAHSADAADGPLRHAFLTSERVRYGVMLRRGDFDEAIRELEALIPVVDREMGELSTEAYNSRIALSTALNRKAVDPRTGSEVAAVRRAQIALLEETARLQAERYGDEDTITLLGAQLVLGRAYADSFRYTEAEQILASLPQRVEDRVGRVHGLYAEAATSMAAIRYARGDYAEAAGLMGEVVARSRELHSARHPNTLGVTRDLLPYLDAAGRVDEGLETARELHETLIGFFGPDGPVTHDARGWVARFCDLAGRLDEAETHYVAMGADVADPAAPDVSGYHAMFHAGHLARRGRFEEAESKLLTLADRVGGVEVGVSSVGHPDDLARMFVEVYDQWGRDDKVREYETVIADMQMR